MKTSIHHLLQNRAASQGSAPAIAYKTITRSYSELWLDVVGVEAGLRTIGLERDDRVAIWLEKRVETVAAIFGTSAAGGVFVPINPLLRPHQVAFILADCAARVLITSAERMELLLSELGGCQALSQVVLVDRGEDVGPQAQPEGWTVHSFKSLCSVADPVSRANGSIDLDMAAILYTSGSTGKPKGVVLSHRNLIVGAESVSHYLKNDPNDVILSALPLSFDAGFSQLTTAFSAVRKSC